MNDNGRIPPHDIGAEEGTVGSLLIDGGAIREVSFLSPPDFYHEPCRHLYEACVAVGERNEAIDQITVAHELDRVGRMEAVGGVAYMSHLISIIPTSLDIVHYANIVQRLSVHRQIIRAGDRIMELGYEADPEPGTALSKADDFLLDIRKRTVGTTIVDPEMRARLLSDRYEALYKQEAGIALKTGLGDLDWRLGGGLYAGDLTLLAARTGMGKTTMLQTIANNVGKEHNVLYCSVEMNWQSMSDRDMAGILGVPIATVRLGAYEDQTYADMMGQGLDALAKIKVSYFDDMPLTAAKVMRAGMEMKMRRGLALIVIDYLGVMDDEYGRSPYERVGFISRKVKQIARVLDVPVLAAHQLNRALEQRPDKHPQLHDLRDSGNLEEDADVVMFLYRENYYDLASESMTAELCIAKIRQGEAGKFVEVVFDKERQCYRGIAREGR